MKKVLDNAEEIKIVGLIKPNPEAVTNSSQAGMVGYKSSFIERIINRTNDSEIVKEQKANEKINVFTGTELLEK